MSLLSGLGKALGGFVRQVAPQVLQAIAPAATSLLGNIAKDVFSKGAGFIGNALKTLNLPSPLAKLATSLLGKGAEALTKFAQGGIEKLISKIADSLMKRFGLPGVDGSVTPPTMTDPGRTTAITNNNPTAPSTGSSASPATGSTPAPATSSSSGAATGATGASGGWGYTNEKNGSGAPPDPRSYDMKDPNQAAQFQQQMMQYQQAMNNINMYFTMVSNVMKAQSDTATATARNIR